VNTDLPQVIVPPFRLELLAKSSANGVKDCGITPLSNYPAYPKVTTSYCYLKTALEREVNLMQAYCVKCRAKKEMKDAKAITMKNGKPATQGICPVCGTKMFRIGKA